MLYQFEKLVCTEQLTDQQLEMWCKDLTAEQREAILQLISNKYIPDVIVPDYNNYHIDTSATKVATGIDALLHLLQRLLPNCCIGTTSCVDGYKIYNLHTGNDNVMTIYYRLSTYHITLDTKQSFNREDEIIISF